MTGYDHRKRQGIHCPGCNDTNVVPQLGVVEVKTSKKS